MRDEKHDHADQMTEDQIRILIQFAERINVWQAAWMVEWMKGDHPEIAPAGGLGEGIKPLPSTPDNVIAYFSYILG